MSALKPVTYQCHFPDLTCWLTVEDQQLTLKIFDLSKKCIHDQTFPLKDLSLSNVEQLLVQGKFARILAQTVKKQLLPQKTLTPTCTEVTRETCQKAFDYAIKQFSPSAILETTGEGVPLAHLYTAKNEFQRRQLPKAIQTLENCQLGKQASPHVNFVLIRLYLLDRNNFN